MHWPNVLLVRSRLRNRATHPDTRGRIGRRQIVRLCSGGTTTVRFNCLECFHPLKRLRHVRATKTGREKGTGEGRRMPPIRPLTFWYIRDARCSGCGRMRFARSLPDHSVQRVQGPIGARRGLRMHHRARMRSRGRATPKPATTPAGRPRQAGIQPLHSCSEASASRTPSSSRTFRRRGRVQRRATGDALEFSLGLAAADRCDRLPLVDAFARTGGCGRDGHGVRQEPRG